MSEKAKKQLDFLILIDEMKSIYRRTLLMNRERRENDAEHSWHIALAGILLAEHCPDHIDIFRVTKMLLVHDLVEIYAGDTFCYDKAANADKELREKEAADRLFYTLPYPQSEELKTLWEEFDQMETPDSRFGAAMDRLLPFLANCHTEGATWREGAVHRASVLERLAPIEKAAPAVWEELLPMVDLCVEKGFLSA